LNSFHIYNLRSENIIHLKSENIVDDGVKYNQELLGQPLVLTSFSSM